MSEERRTDAELLARAKAEVQELYDEIMQLREERWTEEDAERYGSHSYQLGVSQGMESAAAEIMEKARGLWSSGQDETAKLLRSLAKLINDKAAVARPDSSWKGRLP